MPSDPILTVHNLTKEYTLKTPYDTLVSRLSALFKKKTKPSPFLALKGVSFSVLPGERIGIIGRNGAGKSTLLKILSKVTHPTSGKIQFNGRVASLLEVGTGFHLELTGRENIFLSGSILGMSRREILKRFDEIVAFAEVEAFLDTPVKHYSSGMMTRLGFAVGAHLDPDLMIIDEVLSVGDAPFQEKCLAKMRGLANLGKTFLFVSHNESLLRRFCTKGLLLERGEQKFFGRLEEGLNLYREMRGFLPRWDGVLKTPHATFLSFFVEKSDVVLHYTLDNPHPDLFFEFTLWNSQGSLIGRSNVIPKGCPFRFKLPIHHLHEGEYTLCVNAHLHNIRPLLNEPLAIKVAVSPKLGSSHFETGTPSDGIALYSTEVL